MASILDRYGIKEVADVTFYKIKNDGTRGDPVLYLDTLKVSTIEQTAETVDARGGKGNPKLVTWDYGKEITVSIEDALFSSKSMSIMFGDGTVAQGSTLIQKTATIRMGSADTTNHVVKCVNDYVVADVYDSVEGSKRVKLYIGPSTAPTGEVALTNQIAFTGPNSITSKLYDEDGTVLDEAFTLADLKALYSTGQSTSGLSDETKYDGHKFMFTYWVAANGKQIVISGDTFPGTYYVQGDTYARSDVDGRDQFFQFIIPKAKMTSENTITLEAEGDPAVFNMNLTVLRPEDGDMMKLIQYDLTAPA